MNKILSPLQHSIGYLVLQGPPEGPNILVRLVKHHGKNKILKYETL